MKKNLIHRWLQATTLLIVSLTAATNLSLAAAETATNTVAESTNAAVATTRGPAWMSFGLERIEWLHLQVLGNPLWQYLASLIYVILAFYVSKLLDYVIQVQLRKWAAKTATKFDDLLLELLRGPVKVIAFVILLHIGLRVFAWPEWMATFISNGLKIIVACSLTYVAIKFVDLLMGLWQQRVESAQEGMLDLHLFPIIRKTLKIFVMVVAVLVTSQNLGMNVTGLLASLSIGGLAVGLAAQDTLSNLFGAVAIFADKPFRVGDRIQLDTIDGTVEAIGLRSTRVRNLDGYLVTIPNKTMANANIINISKRPNIKTVMNIGVTYDTPAQTDRAGHADYRGDLPAAPQDGRPAGQLQQIRQLVPEHPGGALVELDRFQGIPAGLSEAEPGAEAALRRRRHQLCLPQPDGLPAAGFAVAPRRVTR